MQRNPYWPLNGPSFFSTIDIPSQGIALTVQVAQSASGSNFAARMASRRNLVSMLTVLLVPAQSLDHDFLDPLRTDAPVIFP